MLRIFRSVLDLSMRPPGSLDIQQTFNSPSQPASPTTPRGLGDLRNISRKGWSRSADDLGKFSSPMASPVDSSFHNKITQYRNRSNSNATIAPSSPIGHPTPSSLRQPFPSIVTSSPLSSSPPQDTGISISVSTPTTLEKPLPQDPGHNRSHSFTPRLPSKLSAPKMGLSPKRKGSAPSEHEIEKDIEALTARANKNLGQIPDSSPAASLAPPTIVEPEPDLNDDMDMINDTDIQHGSSKRASQIVYNAGFINRLTELPASHHPYHAPNLTLAKGWKPFKLELKGSKLFFYKPPGDRAAAVRELFPVGLVPAIEEEDEGGDKEAVGAGDELLPGAKRLNAKEDAPPMRKKRAYWGRGTHPNLVHGGAGVEKGTFEALVHEAVFATTFLKSLTDKAERDKQYAQWRDFASAVLLCLPSMVGFAKFENEFTRYCAYLVSGNAADTGTDAKKEERARVMWLAGEYIRCHGGPTEAEEWEEWRTDTIPEFSAHSDEKPTAEMTTSASTQAIYTRSPNMSIDSPLFSPNLGTFSPRPEDSDKMASLMEALAGPAVPTSPSGAKPPAFHQQRGGSVNNSRIWAALDREGLSREVLLMLDPHLIARSLGLFHRSALQEIPENLTAQYIIGSETTINSNNKHLSLPLETTDGSAPSVSSLFGSEKSPHWLTKILLMQILGVDTSTGSLTSPQLSSARASEDRQVQTTSRTHSRSEVISVWARIGELCRLAGDECSWRAIAAALCSRPVARLDKAWKRVSADALSIVDSWVYPGADGECAGVQDPRITPWGGDVKDRIKEALERSRGDGGEGWLVGPLTRVREMFEGTRTMFSLCPRRSLRESAESGEDVNRLMTFWGDLCAGNVRSGTLGSKFLQ